MQAFSTTKQSGFTLIELVMVIVILGILSAFAIPKFANLSKEAGRAVFAGYEGAFEVSLKQFQLKWIVENRPSTAFSPYSSVPNAFGFPAGGSNTSSAFVSDCQMILADLLNSHEIPINVDGGDGWAASVTNETWAINAWRVGALGESSDTYCHFIYLDGLQKGIYSGLTGDRIPVIQYSIVTGEMASLEWPYDP